MIRSSHGISAIWHPMAAEPAHNFAAAAFARIIGIYGTLLIIFGALEDSMLQILARADKARSLVSRFRSQAVDQAGRNAVIDVPMRTRLGFFGWSFIFCVILPTVVTAAYLTFVASDEYVSEAKFTIRKASENGPSALGSVVNSISAAVGMGIDNGTTTQDVYIVAEYIRSRSIIEDLGGKSQLFKVYSRPDIDWLSRLSPSVSLEKAWKFWKNKIDALIDTPSGVITLDVRAYTREDAHRLAEDILNKSEALVNAISERSRNDALTRARDEMKRAEDRVRQAQMTLLAFRNETKLINPAASAESIGETIAKLTQERLLLENNRATLRSSVDSNAPTLRVLNAQIGALDSQIEGLKNQLTSRTQGTAMSSQIAGYENLQLEVRFAEKLYSITQSAYQAAKTEQEKQQLYLVTVDRPSDPQVATYPKIFLDSVTIFAACFILWSMANFLIGTVRDHMGG